MLEEAMSEILEPSTLHPLRLERDSVDAVDVFHDQRIWRSLQEYRKALRQYEEEGKLPDSVEKINKMTVPDGYVPVDLSHQDVTGTQLIKQIRLIEEAPFLKAITSHPYYRELPGFEKYKKLSREAASALSPLIKVSNFFRKKKIHTVLGSPAELKFAQQCFGNIWPVGVNLYSILREMYPAFHARLTGQIHIYLAKKLKNLLDVKVNRNTIWGIGRFTVDDDGRLLGLYPVAEVPIDQVTLDSQFASQDQLGRRAIIIRVLYDVIEILQRNKNQRVMVIDYGGGVGNTAELLLKQVYAHPEREVKLRLLKQLRITVIDFEDDQLAAGRNRFNQMSHKPGLEGINEKIIFIKGDVAEPLSEQQLKIVREKFGTEFVSRSIYVGVTSYTLGALDNLSRNDGKTTTHAMADAIFKQCWKIYAVDFSSPMWRLKDFLRDTGKWGKEYLRTIHGCADEKDKHTLVSKGLATVLKLRYGLEVDTVADFVRLVALVPGLASHYTTVWPGSYGHNSGYTILEDGSLRKPSILSFAEHLQSYGIQVNYKSKVWLFATLDIGRTSKRTRAWAFIPGWVADFVVAQNDSNYLLSPNK